MLKNPSDYLLINSLLIKVLYKTEASSEVRSHGRARRVNCGYRLPQTSRTSKIVQEGIKRKSKVFHGRSINSRYSRRGRNSRCRRHFHPPHRRSKTAAQALLRGYSRPRPHDVGGAVTRLQHETARIESQHSHQRRWAPGRTSD